MHNGQLIAGRYRLAEQIGAGGNGVVWRAIDEELDRAVAIKRALVNQGEQGLKQLKLMRREAKILAQLNHPNIVTLFDVIVNQSDCWLVMEFVPYRSLADRGILSPEQAVHIGVQIADALIAVHAAGIVHRDIKPSNVLMADDGRVKLGDFGISKTVTGDLTFTDSGLLVGTPGYVAPEVANGLPPTTASDVFSLGATLFAAVEGNSPYGPLSDPIAVLQRAAAGEVTGCHHSGPLTSVVDALLAVRPAERPTAQRAKTLLSGVFPTTLPADLRRITPARPRRVPLSVQSRRSAIYPRILPRKRLVIGGAFIGLVLTSAIVAQAVFHFPFNAREQSQRGQAIPPSIGEPQSADPCALIDVPSFDQFGKTEFAPSYGNFNRCDVIVRSTKDSEVDVMVELDDAPTESAWLSAHPNQLQIVRQSEGGDSCDRIVLLPTTGRIIVSAEQDGTGQADLCAMADVATKQVKTVLSKGDIPQRKAAEVPANSLITKDSCALVPRDALAQFPGVDLDHPEIGFGNWECRWNSKTSPSSLLVKFDRNTPLDKTDGDPIRLAGKQAYLDDSGFGKDTCGIQIVSKQYVDVVGEDTVELILVVVEGKMPAQQRCQLAMQFAGQAAAAIRQA